jgi:hypothetical protein
VACNSVGRRVFLGVRHRHVCQPRCHNDVVGDPTRFVANDGGDTCTDFGEKHRGTGTLTRYPRLVVGAPVLPPEASLLTPAGSVSQRVHSPTTSVPTRCKTELSPRMAASTLAGIVVLAQQDLPVGSDPASGTLTWPSTKLASVPARRESLPPATPASTPELTASQQALPTVGNVPALPPAVLGPNRHPLITQADSAHRSPPHTVESKGFRLS